MQQIAIFVDAGYLYAQGSTLLTGRRQKRPDIQLSVSDVVDALKRSSQAMAPLSRLLRIYWYDGMLRGGRLTEEQSTIAQSHDLKLRLGMVNSHGEQKGVDSLIVTDMIELARNQAISDALIVSGDEDIRVGVQVAQTFGVRVHLLGIEPARSSQSPDLLQEVDTCLEWQKNDVAGWMNITVRPTGSDDIAVHVETSPITKPTTKFAEATEAAIGEAIHALTPDDLARVVNHLDSNRNQIPGEIDRPALSRLSQHLGRPLTDDERRIYRRSFVARLREGTAKV